MSTEPKVGVAWFKRGLACNADGQVFAFNTTDLLDAHTIWLTDLSIHELEHQHPGKYRLKADAYFSIKLSTIISDLALSTLNDTDMIQVVRALFAWAVQSVAIVGGTLNDALDSAREHALVLELPERKPHSKALQYALAKLIQPYCHLTRSTPDNRFHAYLPPAKLYRTLMKRPIPINGFRFIDYGRDPITAVQVRSDSHLAFVCVSAFGFIEKAKQLNELSFDSRFTHDQEPLWLSVPEYLYLIERCGETSVDAAITAQEFSNLEAYFQPSESAVNAPVESLSYSVGLLYSSLLASAAGVRRRVQGFPQAYLLSLIRLQQAKAVIDLISAEIPVIGYGVGRFSFSAIPEQWSGSWKKSFLEIADHHQLQFSAVNLGVPLAQDKESSAYRLVFRAMAEGDSRSLVELNHYALQQIKV